MWKRLLAFTFCLLLAPAVWAAIPTYVGSGTLNATLQDTDATNASALTLANDIILLFIETNAVTATVAGGTETWAEVADSPQTVTSLTELTVFWARASVNFASLTMPTITSTGSDHIISISSSFRGVITTGDPWDVTSGGTEAVEDTTGSITGDTTTVDDCLIVAIMATDLPDANDVTNYSGEANADLANFTARIESCKNTGNGGCIFTMHGDLASFGAYGATTLTLEDAAQKAFMTIALKPPVAGDGPTYWIVD